MHRARVHRETETAGQCRSCAYCNERIPLFSTLTPEELNTLNQDRFSARFKPGELILKQGITSTHVVHLIHGSARVLVEVGTERNLLVYLMKPWMLLDDAAAQEYVSNQFSVTALTDAQVCFMRADAYRKVLASNNRFAGEIIRQRHLTSTLYLDRMVSLSQKSMTGRMADGLLYLARDFYRSTRFECDLSRQDLADLTAMSKDSAIRTLKELERNGIISLSGNHIQIHQPETLQKLAEVT